ncbi:MAG: guanylate kinase [Bacteroidota bacterium]
MSDKIIIFSAPSGAGKTTVVRHILKKFRDVEFSISACTRQRRLNEIDGKDYYFISAEEFKHKIKKHEFAEWEEVYPRQFYGTLKSEVKRIWSIGKQVIFDVDVQGGLNLKQQFGKKAFAIFIMPPSIEILEFRLKGRKTETKKGIVKRIDKAKQEILMAYQFDEILVNENLDTTCAEAENLVGTFLKNKINE